MAAATERHKDPEQNEADEGHEKGGLWAIVVRVDIISFPCRIGACKPTYLLLWYKYVLYCKREALDRLLLPKTWTDPHMATMK